MAFIINVNKQNKRKTAGNKKVCYLRAWDIKGQIFEIINAEELDRIDSLKDCRYLQMSRCRGDDILNFKNPFNYQRLFEFPRLQAGALSSYPKHPDARHLLRAPPLASPCILFFYFVCIWVEKDDRSVSLLLSRHALFDFPRKHIFVV